MIGRVVRHGGSPAELLSGLYHPAGGCAESGAHLVAGWRYPAELEPPLRQGGSRDFQDLTRLLGQPLALLGDRAPAAPVWHCDLRTAPDDPDLADGAWMRIAGEIMHRTGLSRYGEEARGVRWVAVRHGGRHVHIVATLARQDGRPARLDNEFRRIGAVLREMEEEYGLRRASRGMPAAARSGAAARTEAARLTRLSFPATTQAGPSTQASHGGAATIPRRPGDTASSIRQPRPGGPQ